MTQAITGSAYAAVIATTARKLGAPLPAGLRTALDAAAALRTTTAQIEASSGAANAAIIECLRAQKDWRTDKAVQALLFERVATDCGIRAAGVDRAEEMVVTAIIEHTDAVIAAWSEALAPDVEALRVAATKLDIPILKDADAPDVSRRGLLSVWSDAMRAEQRFRDALDGWGMIAQAARVARNRHHQPFAITAELPDTITLAEGPAITAWDLARAGAQLSLATPAEYQQRVARHEAAVQARRREDEETHQRDRKAALRA